MSIIDIILRRSRAYRLRKKYDKMREKADKIKNIDERIEILRMLDQIEPSIITLEEHNISHFEKKRTVQYVESSLRKIKFLMSENKKGKNSKKNYFKDNKPIR